MSRAFPLLVATAFAAVAGGFTSCSTATRPAPTPAADVVATPAAAVAPTGSDGARRGYAEADVRFMHHMIAHHGQALAMTALVPTRSGREDVRLLAQRIEVSQRDESALMQRWLRERGEVVPDPNAHAEHHAEHHEMSGQMAGGGGERPSMPGMLTPEEMARLTAARGAEFDRLFLEYMIRHHEGALRMVAELLASKGAAQEPEVFRLASDVDADQRAEIGRMRALLRLL